jgi:hypothetical protein
MYSRKLVLAALAGGLLMTTTLSAQRNYPTPRPKTVGNSILTNGGFEDPTISTPIPPTRPKDFPKDLVPQSSSDTFYENEETKEGGIAEQIKQYGEDEEITYTEAQLKEFKTFVEEYVAYLKKKEKTTIARPSGWYFSPTGVFSHNFVRATKSPAENGGKSYIRLAGPFGQTQQIFTYEPNDGFIPVNSKAQYLISFLYRGNYPKNSAGSPMMAQKIGYVSLTWKAKKGTTLRLNGKDLPMQGNSWRDDRRQGNSQIKDDQVAYRSEIIGLDLKGDLAKWKEKYMVVEAPENAESVQFSFQFPGENQEVANFLIDIDNVSMTLIEGKEGEPNLPKLVVPNAPTAKSLGGMNYIQREFAVQWEKSTDEVDGYEVEVAEVNGTATQSPKTYTTTGTSYTFEGMEPGKTYQVRVRSTKGEAKSEYSAAFKVQTKALGEFTQDGIPFLSTVNEDGSAPQNLPLYFMELKNPKAKLTCFIDDQEVTTPTNKILKFPSTGNHTLRIIVEEAADRIWELSYELNIK